MSLHSSGLRRPTSRSVQTQVGGCSCTDLAALLGAELFAPVDDVASRLAAPHPPGGAEINRPSARLGGGHVPALGELGQLRGGTDPPPPGMGVLVGQMHVVHVGFDVLAAVKSVM